MIDWKPSGKETPQINEWALIWVDDKNPRYAPYGAVAQYTEDGYLTESWVLYSEASVTHWAELNPPKDNEDS